MAKAVNDRTDFYESFRKLAANWKLPETRAEDIMGEYYDIYAEIGAERFYHAVRSILHNSEYTYFPTISEFRSYIPLKSVVPLCGKCESGWIRVPDYEARRLYNDQNATAMIRCECRRGPKFQKYEKRVVEWKP